MKVLVCNINDFCGESNTMRQKGRPQQAVADAVLEYIDNGAFQLVALQEFPLNSDVGRLFLEKMRQLGFREYHNNDVVGKKTWRTSGSVTFVIGEGMKVNRKVFEPSLRYVCVNVNGIDLLNVHAALNARSYSYSAIEQYSRMHVGFIVGDFNTGLYLKQKTPALYAAYRRILDNGFTDVLMEDNKEQITNTVTQTAIDHVLDKGIRISSCTVDVKATGLSDHLPLLLEY